MAKNGASTTESQLNWIEKELERWFLRHPGLPDEPLLLIRRQEPISRVVDLLFVDEKRRLVLIEIKNEKTTRLALGQALEYLGSYHDYELEDLCEDVSDFDSGRDLKAEFQQAFGKALDSLSTERRVVLAAPDFDVPSAVACNYLGHVLSNVTVSMLKAKRVGSGFTLAWHTPPNPVRMRRLAGGLAQSPSGRRVFSILKSGAKPIVWWVGRVSTRNGVSLPSDKRRAIFRTNRRVVPVDAVKGVDVSEQGACWERKDDPTKLARLLGVVTTDSGSQAILIRIGPRKPPKVRYIPLGEFKRKWTATDGPVPSWTELVDQLVADKLVRTSAGASRSRKSPGR